MGNDILILTIDPIPFTSGFWKSCNAVAIAQDVSSREISLESYRLRAISVYFLNSFFFKYDIHL